MLFLNRMNTLKVALWNLLVRFPDNIKNDWFGEKVHFKVKWKNRWQSNNLLHKQLLVKKYIFLEFNSLRNSLFHMLFALKMIKGKQTLQTLFFNALGKIIYLFQKMGMNMKAWQNLYFLFHEYSRWMNYQSSKSILG